MSRTDDQRSSPRASKFETLEVRLALSGQPLSDIAPIGVPLTSAGADQVITLADNAQFQQVANIQQQYGFTGKGQTVAIIDTGIAWDHLALGGGYGPGYKVVGGWDFAENDANPYDDGPFGFHGTHVAGIVGNTDATRYGVASGVDLVALRVFNDNGVSDFNWVEQALQWVHQHKNDFANPITTVNLSVGTRTNLMSLPALATLEDEFAQLEADGIFISVAAGNAFKSYAETGLTYPAISPNVVPVASHDANGSLSDFSQRADQVLVAPGRSIVSTVPDHVFAGTQTNGFMMGTGTSMASPYVAGASALLREAMTFMGYENITQDALYNHFRETADKFYDAATSHYYNRINIAAAIDAVVADDHSDLAASANQLGELSNQLSIRGTIGKHGDLDQFAFTANSSGTVTLTIDSTHDLSPVLGVNGVTQQLVGRQVTFAVQAGQKYVLSLGTSDSIGHYTAALQMNRSVNAAQWGTVGQRVIENLSVDGEQWYSLKAGQTGVLTLEGIHVAGVSKLELYNDRMQLVATAGADGGNLRLDRSVQQNESYFVRVAGSTSQLDVRVTNLVSLDGGRLSIFGTSLNDDVYVSAGGSVDVRLNDVAYRFSSGNVSRVEINGFGGNDKLHLDGSQGDDWFRLDVGSLRMTNAQISVDAQQFETVTAVGRGGFDVAIATDSAGNDVLIDSASWTRVQGQNFEHLMGEFERTRVISRGGTDQAYLTDSVGNDVLSVRDGVTVLRTNERTIIADQFAKVTVFGSQGGNDLARIADTSADDAVVLKRDFAALNDSFKAFGFETVQATAGVGRDSVVFEVATGVESVAINGGRSQLVGGQFSFSAEGFEAVTTVVAISDSLGTSSVSESFAAASPRTTHSQMVFAPSYSSIPTWQVPGVHSGQFSSTAQNILAQRISGLSILTCQADTSRRQSYELVDTESHGKLPRGLDQVSLPVDTGSDDSRAVIEKHSAFEELAVELPIKWERDAEVSEMGAVDHFYRTIGD